MVISPKIYAVFVCILYKTLLELSCNLLRLSASAEMTSVSATRRPTTRAGRRQRSIALYQSGKSRGPYSLSRTLNSSINNSHSEGEESVQDASNALLTQVGTNKDSAMCCKCRPIL